MSYYVINCKLKKIVFLLYYNLLIKKSIKEFSFVSYILILKNFDYGRNNKCYIIIIYLFGEGHKLYVRGRQIFKYGPVYYII
jgi:hypothetical protein